MLAMQYGFDVDQPDAVRQRVKEIGSRFDQLPGLYFKAFLVADADAGRPARYTPFYVWRDMEGMRQFLLSDAFRAVVAKYGRPSVGRWTELALQLGQSVAQPPRFALQSLVDIPREEDIPDWVGSRLEMVADIARSPGLHSVYVGLDETSWQLMSISLWSAAPPPHADGRLYEVAHLSAPGLAQPG